MYVVDVTGCLLLEAHLWRTHPDLWRAAVRISGEEKKKKEEAKMAMSMRRTLVSLQRATCSSLKVVEHPTDFCVHRESKAMLAHLFCAVLDMIHGLFRAGL